MIKRACKAILKWFDVIAKEREQSLEALVIAVVLNQLHRYIIRFEEIFNQVVKEKMFTWWKTNAQRAREKMNSILRRQFIH
jgi:hypothetical protein